jgi:16S rRNA (cytosine1402-N4)-methyltransferase
MCQGRFLLDPHMTVHRPVLANEVIAGLSPAPGMIVVDGTLGGGGHTRLLAERVGPTGRVIAMDRDPAAVRASEAVLADLPVHLVHASYHELTAVLRSISIDAVDAILLDLGLSSDQLADPRRGFSFQAGGELDMRFDPTMGRPAWELIERLSERELADVIYQFGEERFSRRIARRMVEQRARQPIRTASELAALVRGCVPRARGHAIDPATRTFQALRIAVNEELSVLREALDAYQTILKPGRRLAVISFHSLEDRIVKHGFRDDPGWEVITRRPIRAGEDEIAANPRARSARLRIAARAVAGMH